MVQDGGHAGNLRQFYDFYARVLERLGGPAGGDDFPSQIYELFSKFRNSFFVVYRYQGCFLHKIKTPV